MKKKYDYVGKRDWRNLRIGYDEDAIIQILDKKFGFKFDEVKEAREK